MNLFLSANLCFLLNIIGRFLSISLLFQLFSHCENCQGTGMPACNNVSVGWGGVHNYLDNFVAVRVSTQSDPELVRCFSTSNCFAELVVMHMTVDDCCNHRVEPVGLSYSASEDLCQICPPSKIIPLN